MLLAIPLKLLKVLSLDFPFLIRMSPYLVQMVLVLICDLCFWKISKKLIGSQASRLALLLYLTNRMYTEVIIRCLTNGIEAILTIVAFDLFLKMSNSVDLNNILMTALITI